MASISLFGWLDNIPFWRDLPYPTKGSLTRAMKAGLSAGIGVLVAALAAGTLLPVTASPIIVVVVTMLLQAVDKYLRERAAAADAEAEAGYPVETPSVPTAATDTTDTKLPN